MAARFRRVPWFAVMAGQETAGGGRRPAAARGSRDAALP
jgi:hypothetical protein